MSHPDGSPEEQRPEAPPPMYSTPMNAPSMYGPPPGGGVAPGWSGAPAPWTPGPLGKVRSTGGCVLLTIVTLGFYTWYWYYKTHGEMKQHTGAGLGGGLALLLAVLVGIVMPFLTSNEVGELYGRRGQARPVTALTGLWALLLGWVFFVGLIVWFVRTNGALNDYWRSLGAH